VNRDRPHFILIQTWGTLRIPQQETMQEISILEISEEISIMSGGNRPLLEGVK
jgi:hypothetical protein